MGDMKELLRMMVQAIDVKEQFEKAADKSKPDEEIRKALQEHRDDIDKIFDDSPNRKITRDIMKSNGPKAWEYGYNDVQRKLEETNKKIDERMMNLQIDMIKGIEPRMGLGELIDMAIEIGSTLQYASFMLECIHGPIMEYVKKHE